MSPSQALALQKELVQLCVKQGVWVKIEHDFKPDLKMIRMEISIKVETE